LHLFEQKKPKRLRDIGGQKAQICVLFFEPTMQEFLILLSSFSQNTACESFSLGFDEGYDSNINFGETLDLHIETCDLLPFVINPSNEAFS
jgi:hypothetical protein